MKANQLTRETIRGVGLRDNILPDFSIGDRIAVSLRIKEVIEKKGKKEVKERIQVFEGDVIARHKKGSSSSFTVRKITSGFGVERILPDNSPLIDSVKVVRRGKVRRAKLYYLRDRVGKATRIKEKRVVKHSAKKDASAVEKTSSQKNAA